MTGMAMRRARPPALVPLRQLRRRLGTAFALISGLGVTVFLVLLVLIDTADRRDRLVSDLRGQASRAAALMYESAGQARTDAVVDDTVAEPPSRLLVFERGGGSSGLELVLRSRSAQDVDSALLEPLARRALLDPAETGSVAVVRGHNGVDLQAVAMPWFKDGGREIAGATIALATRPGRSGSPLLVPVSVGAGLLILVLGGAGWILTGRSMRPALSAVADREAFLATAAHELRTPLARLRAGAETVQRAARHDVEHSAALASLVSMAESAGHVVSDLLLATRIDHAEVPVHRVATRLDVLAADAEHLDPVVVVDVTGAVDVVADPHLLRHALTNLVGNAVRHARSHSDRPLVLVSAFRRQGVAVLRVNDNGLGFPADLDLGTAFASQSAGGTGLGLALVDWIARAHAAELVLTNVRDPLPGAQAEIVFPHPSPGHV